MRLTSPTTPPTSIWSPTLIGRSSIRMSPEAKLLTTLCNPIPTPIADAPASSVTLVRSMPSAAIASTKPVTTST